jgi:Cu/Ag efflux protein CusF
MTKTFAVLALSAALPVFAQAPAPASAPPPAPTSVSESAVTHVTGTIEAISPTTREVTVKINGELHTFAVKPDVKRFSELKVGDKLNADYYEAVVMELRKPGDKAPQAASGGEVVRVPGMGTKPSGALVQQQVASVEVKAIDTKTPAITVLTEDARIVTMKVKHPSRLKAVKVGDKIDVLYTEALIVGIE